VELSAPGGLELLDSGGLRLLDAGGAVVFESHPVRARTIDPPGAGSSGPGRRPRTPSVTDPGEERAAKHARWTAAPDPGRPSASGSPQPVGLPSHPPPGYPPPGYLAPGYPAPGHPVPGHLAPGYFTGWPVSGTVPGGQRSGWAVLDPGRVPHSDVIVGPGRVTGPDGDRPVFAEAGRRARTAGGARGRAAAGGGGAG